MPVQLTYGEYQTLLENNQRLREALRAIRLAAKISTARALREICLTETDRFSDLTHDTTSEEEAV